MCSCERRVLWDMCILGGQESIYLSRQLRLLPSLCENAVKSGLAWSVSRWSDSSACSARTQGAMMIGPAPDESPISVLSENSHIMGWQPHQIWSYEPLKSTMFHEFGLRGWMYAAISRERYMLRTQDLHHWIYQRLRFVNTCGNIVTTPSDLEQWAPELNQFVWI